MGPVGPVNCVMHRRFRAAIALFVGLLIDSGAAISVQLQSESDNTSGDADSVPEKHDGVRAIADQLRARVEERRRAEKENDSERLAHDGRPEAHDAVRAVADQLRARVSERRRTEKGASVGTAAQLVQPMQEDPDPQKETDPQQDQEGSEEGWMQRLRGMWRPKESDAGIAGPEEDAADVHADHSKKDVHHVGEVADQLRAQAEEKQRAREERDLARDLAETQKKVQVTKNQLAERATQVQATRDQLAEQERELQAAQKRLNAVKNPSNVPDDGPEGNWMGRMHSHLKNFR